MILRNLIGDELRQIRLDKNLTLRGVAETAFVSYSYLSELERGQKEASSETIASLCAALGVPMSDLLFGVSEKLAKEEVR